MIGKMKAVVMRAPKEYGIEEVDIPQLGYGEVLIRVRSVAICGSDPKLFDGVMRPTWPREYPYISGHEFSGEIVEIGDGVADFKVGDRVAGEGHLGCNHCENCAKGLYNLCLNYGKADQGHRHYGHLSQGAFATYAAYNARALSILPDNVSFDEAAMLDTATTAFNGIRLIGVEPGGTTAIVGPGPVGLFALQLVRVMGSKAIVIGRGARLQKAAELGAEMLVDMTIEDPVEAVNRLTNGRRCDQVIECVGKEEAIQQSIKMAKRGGKVVLLGMSPKPDAVLPVKTMVMDQILVTGSRASSNAFPTVLELFSSGAVNAKTMITHVYPLDQIKEAVETFVTRRDGAIKVIIHP